MSCIQKFICLALLDYEIMLGLGQGDFFQCGELISYGQGAIVRGEETKIGVG